MLTKTHYIAVIEKPASVATELELTLADLKILAGIHDGSVSDIKNQKFCLPAFEECQYNQDCCTLSCDEDNFCD